MERKKLNTATTLDGKAFSKDSFTNFAASLGYGASNLTSGGSYGFNPITRNHTLLEWMYRGSWIVRQIVDCVADDMTRQGISVESDMKPDQIDELMDHWEKLMLWQRLNACLKWSRLYGGALCAIMINGQKPQTKLNIDTVGKDQFDGLRVLDRWMVWPHLESMVTDPASHDYGLPQFYESVTDAKALPHMKLHHTRCIRMDGIELPYWQWIAENNWGLSVLEPLYDRLLAFDSTSSGAAQLVYRAHLRTLKIEKLRDLIAFGGPGYQAIQEQLKMIRLFQSNEQLTVLDSTDEFETHQYAFGGLADVIIQFSQQLSGAAGIPLVRLFGQSPAGLNATGDADIRNYYDFLRSQQETRLRRPVRMLLDLCHRSLFGKPLPKGFDFSFNPLWQMTDDVKAAIAVDTTNSVAKAFEDGIINASVAMKELRQMSKVNGLFSNITDEDIEEAEDMPPPHEMAMQGMPMGVGAKLGGIKPKMGMGGAAAEGKMFGAGAKKPAPAKATAAPKPKPATKDSFIMDALPEGISAIVGPDEESKAVWLIEHSPHGRFEEFKAMLGYNDRDSALAGYRSQFDDSSLGTVKRISLTNLRSLASDMKPEKANGHA